MSWSLRGNFISGVGQDGRECTACRCRLGVSRRGVTMEREKELAKLINVLRRTSRMAQQSEWTGGKEDAAAYCTDQYNRVLARLKELDAGVSAVFEPLPAGSSLTVVAMASRQLAAYYEDELGPTKGFGGGGGYGFAVDPRILREFW